jgi:hypothetical protein
MLKYIVTGTGRSGTVFMARVLTDLGVPCGHESIFNHDAEVVVMRRFHGFDPPTISICSDNSGWLNLNNIIADSSYMAMPYLDHEDINEVPVIHVVRNPLAVISSFVKDLSYFNNVKDNPFNKGNWEEWIYKIVPEINLGRDPVERACIYYVLWNSEIEDKCSGASAACKNRPYFRLKAEEPFKDEFFEFIGMARQPVTFINKRINSMKKRTEDFTLDDIPDGGVRFNVKVEFINIMKRYGYL